MKNNWLLFLLGAIVMFMIGFIIGLVFLKG